MKEAAAAATNPAPRKNNAETIKALYLHSEKKTQESLRKRKMAEEILFQERGFSCFDGAFTALFPSGTRKEDEHFKMPHLTPDVQPLYATTKPFIHEINENPSGAATPAALIRELS